MPIINPIGGGAGNGLSAYQVAVAAGFIGDEAAWLLSLKGEVGDRGLPGLKGDTGNAGSQGIQGTPGVKGDTGTTGLKGDRGDIGLQGTQGIKGDTGNTGPKGDTGSQGIQGNTGSQGIKGDTGNQGIQGIQGIQGVKGDTGAQGPATAWGNITGTLASQTDLGTALGAKQATGLVVLANDTLAQALTTNFNTKLTVTAARTLTTTVPAAGTRCSVLILTSGTTSYTITFGTGFKPTGTLATGTTNARIFVINFISDGTNLYEAGRTAAMVA